MPVLKAKICGARLDDVLFIGAIADETGIWAWPSAVRSAQSLKNALGDKLQVLAGLRGAFRVLLARETMEPIAQPDLGMFDGKTVLVAVRNGERAEAVGDWLSYHAREHGAEAALIFDRSKPGDTSFADALDTELPVLVVTSDRPLGRADGPDMRHPATAPAALKSIDAPVDPWHGPMAEPGLHDLLRHMFLASARAVAFVDIADLILPLADGETVFDRAIAAQGKAVPLKGIETYPWRLRQGTPAPHVDHTSSRRTERRALISYAIAPVNQPAEAFWRTGRPVGVEQINAPPVLFIRAMGVVYPGAAVNQIVRKSELREQAGLVTVLSRAFGVEPLRLPAPAQIAPRPKSNALTLVTAMKNEGPFVLDWVAHNRAIGVSRILAYTNDCEDGTDDILRALGEAGVLHRDNPYRSTGKVPQYAAFRAAEEEAAVQDADWLMTLDVDEFLNIHAGEGCLTDLLEAAPDAHAVSIPWRMFGNADRHGFEDAPVTTQFTLCAPEYAPRPLQAWAFKTLYRNEGLFRRLGVHRPKGLSREVRDTLVWVDADGKPLPPAVWDKAWRMSKAQWGYGLATLNHYAVRSAESFLVKRDRGKVNRTTREQGLAYWFRMNHNAEEDRSILRLGDRVAAEKAALLSLPGVRDAHDRAVAWHRSKIASLRQDPDHADIYDQITTPRMEHLSRIATNFGANVHLVGPQVIPDEIAFSDPEKPFYWTVKLAPTPKV